MLTVPSFFKSVSKMFTAFKTGMICIHLTDYNPFLYCRKCVMPKVYTTHYHSKIDPSKLKLSHYRDKYLNFQVKNIHVYCFFMCIVYKLWPQNTLYTSAQKVSSDIFFTFDIFKSKLEWLQSQSPSHQSCICHFCCIEINKWSMVGL